MILFWLICAVFVAIALAFVLPPLMQTSEQGSPDGDNDESRKEANVAIYRDQISELEADVANGIVSQEQYQLDRNEIERRMLEDVSGAERVPDKNATAATTAGLEKRGKGKGETKHIGGLAVYSVALGIPVIAVALYLQLGNRAALSGVPVSAGSATQAPFAGAGQPQGQMTQQAIEANVAKLAARMEQNPADVQGWIMLGRSYLNLEKYREASAAFAKASALKPDDADLLGDYAFSLGMANGQRLQGQPLELINKALKVDPENPKALELAGSAAFETKNYNQAIDYWQKLLKKTSPNTELGQALSKRISEAKSLAGTGAK